MSLEEIRKAAVQQRRDVLYQQNWRHREDMIEVLCQQSAYDCGERAVFQKLIEAAYRALDQDASQEDLQAARALLQEYALPRERE